MGKGDKKSKRGKIIIGSYGVSRAKRKKKAVTLTQSVAPSKEKKEKPAKVVKEEPVEITEVVTEVVEVKEMPVAEVAEAPAKKKATKTTKKAKVAEPELNLDIQTEAVKEEKPETPSET